MALSDRDIHSIANLIQQATKESEERIVSKLDARLTEMEKQFESEFFGVYKAISFLAKSNLKLCNGLEGMADKLKELEKKCI